MALTKEDLLAIGELIDTKLEPMKSDICGMKSEVSGMKSDIRKLNETVAKIEVEHGQKLSALYDAHLDTVRNATTIQQLDAKVENNTHRIFALEQVVGK